MQLKLTLVLVKFNYFLLTFNFFNRIFISMAYDCNNYMDSLGSSKKYTKVGGVNAL